MRKYLSHDNLKCIVNAFVISRLDYYNSSTSTIANTLIYLLKTHHIVPFKLVLKGALTKQGSDRTGSDRIGSDRIGSDRTGPDDKTWTGCDPNDKTWI